MQGSIETGESRPIDTNQTATSPKAKTATVNNDGVLRDKTSGNGGPTDQGKAISIVGDNRLATQKTIQPSW